MSPLSLGQRQAALDKIKSQIATVSKQYGQHRPLIQRFLTSERGLDGMSA
jgi:hypothetical protein